MHPGAVDDLGVEHADGTSPELVVSGAGSSGKQVNCLARGNRIGVTGLADDADEAILGDRARCPTMLDLAVEPVARSPVVDVITVEKGE